MVLSTMERERLEHEVWSALHHCRKLLLGEDKPCNVAWWMRANHPEYFADLPYSTKQRLDALADEAEKPR
jgi:hypothetical protein